MKPSSDQVKEVRQRTGLGLMEVVKAFGEVATFEDVFTALQQRGVAIAAGRQQRDAKVRRLNTYLHPNGKYASIVEFACETDFVAKSLTFQDFMRNVAMHVAAFDTSDLLVEQGNVVDPKVKVENQPFIKNPNITVGELTAQVSAATGEKVEILSSIRKAV